MFLTFGYESVLGWSQRLGNSWVEVLLVLGLLIEGMSLISQKVLFLSPVSEVPIKYNFLLCRFRVKPLFLYIYQPVSGRTCWSKDKKYPPRNINPLENVLSLTLAFYCHTANSTMLDLRTFLKSEDTFKRVNRWYKWRERDLHYITTKDFQNI